MTTIDQETYDILKEVMQALDTRLRAAEIVPLNSTEMIELENLRKLCSEQQATIIKQYEALSYLEQHKKILMQQVESLENAYDLIRKTIAMRYAVPSVDTFAETEPKEVTPTFEIREPLLAAPALGTKLEIPAGCNPQRMRACPICTGGPCKFGQQSPTTLADAMPKPIVERKGRNED